MLMERTFLYLLIIVLGGEIVWMGTPATFIGKFIKKMESNTELWYTFWQKCAHIYLWPQGDSTGKDIY